MARLIVHDDVNASFDDKAQQDWADRALIVAHNIIIRVLMIQNSYFELQLDKEIKERKNDFVSIWGRQKAFDLEKKYNNTFQMDGQDRADKKLYHFLGI